MTNLIIEETLETPEVNFNSETGVLKISGRAYSNDITMFYKRLETWLDEYLLNPKELTVVEFHLDYYNSIFQKLLFLFLKKCISILEKNKKLTINWYHNDGDEDSLDASAHYSKVLDFPINNIEYQ